MFVFREGVQFDPILEPGDVRPRFARGHAHQADLPTQMEHLPVRERLDTAHRLFMCSKDPFIPAPNNPKHLKSFLAVL